MTCTQFDSITASCAPCCSVCSHRWDCLGVINEITLRQSIMVPMRPNRYTVSSVAGHGLGALDQKRR